MKAILRGGKHDGAIIEPADTNQTIRVPFWTGEFYRDPYDGELRPAFGAIEYHRTEEITDGLVVYRTRTRKKPA